MLISVVVPHLNQEEFLYATLEALHSQRAVRADVEIIVVDNGSRQLPTELCRNWPDVRLVSETIPGPGPARNRGIGEASGDILAFIDADCRPDVGWLAAIEAAFADAETTIIGGDVRVGYQIPGRPTFVEPYESIYAYLNKNYIASGFSGTGNLATLPSVVAAVGPFGGIEIAEDRDWGLRAGALGYKIRYQPEMIVFHPARKSFSELTRKWDRHIAHDYERMKPRRFAKLLWLARAAAIAGSPVFEAPRVLLSDRVSGPWERLLAFACLTRIRTYRARRMAEILMLHDSRTFSAAWNRE